MVGYFEGISDQVEDIVGCPEGIAEHSEGRLDHLKGIGCEWEDTLG
jgi:hypothetical protein